MNKQLPAISSASPDLQELGTSGAKSAAPSPASRRKRETRSVSARTRANAPMMGRGDQASGKLQGEHVFPNSLVDRPKSRPPSQRRHHTSRVLVTLLFTDIVESTRHVEMMGDLKWSMLLERHRRIVRRQLLQFDGQEIDVPGDGFLATFNTSTSAVNCARAIRAGLRTIGLEIRAGLHAGECELETAKGDLMGIAVHIAARVVRIAEAGQILVSSTVRELVLGSELHFSSGATHTLKGLAYHWQLFSLRDDESDANQEWPTGLTGGGAATRILN